MDKATHEDLSARLKTHDYFELEEFPQEKRELIYTYLFKALWNGNTVVIKHHGNRYFITQLDSGEIIDERGSQMNFKIMTEMLQNGAIVRIKE